ncbi:MAG: GLUG motif-containing protein, partial [Candidatus Sumerlaeales bacterium]|nr:GLUG motif-containing protein [Candidatus Sumerlaeales bacterium]
MTHRSKMTTSIRIATTRAVRQTKEAVMRKLLPVLILALTLTATAGAQTSVTPAGTGTASDPYQITELGHLVWVSDQTNMGDNWSSGTHFKLMNDIDASSTATWNDGAGFTPMGTDDARFNGVFDGNGKKIIGLTIKRTSSSTDYVGLFGRIDSGSTIKDLGLEGGSVNDTSSSVHVGGLVGYSGGTITNCYATGSVSGTKTGTGSVSVGGLVGYSGGTIRNCYASGNVSGTGSSSVSVGGLVGWQAGGTIRNCYASGNVSGTGSSSVSVGGLVGWQAGGTIRNCYASGNVSGINTGTISYSYVYVGGLVGDSGGTITNCYATGEVSGGSFSNGLVSGGSVTNCYYDKETTGHSGTGMGTPKTTAEMKQQSTYENWDFTDTWKIVEGASYPYLRAFGEEVTLTVSVIGNGTVTPPDGVHYYAYGTTVTLNATPVDGWVLSEWHGVNIADAYAANTTVVMDCNKSVTVHFRKKYEISTLTELQAVKDDLAGHYILMNDIDAAETASWNSGAGFVPIGTATAPFTGLFDGNGKKIKGLTIKYSSSSPVYVGMFGYIGSGSTIRDLGLEGGNVSCTNTYSGSGISISVYVGGLVGYSGGTITNCYASGEVSCTKISMNSSSFVYVGGLVGWQAGGTITNCYTSGEVIGTSSFSVHVGGLVGGHEGGSITNCYASGSVIGTGSSNVDVGGLVGYSGGTITNCYASGEVSGSSSSYVYVGGLVGRQNSGSITNCYATGAVSGGNFVGGLVGYHTTGTITNCYASGEVSGTTVGGLIGFSYYITITNCYATGRVTQISPGQYHGGLVGNNQGGTVSNSYYDSQTTGQSDTGKGMPKTTAEMKQQATFVGWNFDTVWMINEGLSYPYLFDTSKPQTKTVTEVPCTLTFKLSSTRNLTMLVDGVAAGATVTVQCFKADQFSAPNPPFKHAENLYKEKLVITGTGLEGLNATLTWNLDSG